MESILKYISFRNIRRCRGINCEWMSLRVRARMLSVYYKYNIADWVRVLCEHIFHQMNLYIYISVQRRRLLNQIFLREKRIKKAVIQTQIQIQIQIQRQQRYLLDFSESSNKFVHAYEYLHMLCRATLYLPMFSCFRNKIWIQWTMCSIYVYMCLWEWVWMIRIYVNADFVVYGNITSSFSYSYSPNHCFF